GVKSLGPLDYANPNSLRFTFYESVLHKNSRATRQGRGAATWYHPDFGSPGGIALRTAHSSITVSCREQANGPLPFTCRLGSELQPGLAGQALSLWLCLPCALALRLTLFFNAFIVCALSLAY